MSKTFMYAVSLTSFCLLGAALAQADDHKKRGWIDISNDTELFDKNCDYKVWLTEEGVWRETWYLEAFDAENAFYTINRESSSWSNEDDFYALNYKDKTKFLTRENSIDVVPFKLCIHDK